LGKKSSEKIAKKLFYIFTRISCPKNGGKKCAKQFIQKPTNSVIKKFGKKERREKERKNVFHIQTNNVTNKRGEKEGNKFSETHE